MPARSVLLAALLLLRLAAARPTVHALATVSASTAAVVSAASAAVEPSGDGDVIASMEVNKGDGQTAVVELRHGEQAAAVATDFCNRVSQDAACVDMISDALRSRASETLRQSAARVFETSVTLDGVPRAFEAFDGQHPHDAATLFCRAHAPANDGCVTQLARALPVVDNDAELAHNEARTRWVLPTPSYAIYVARI